MKSLKNAFKRLESLLALIMVTILLGCSKPEEKKADVIDVKEGAAPEAPARQSPGEPKTGASPVLLKNGTAAALIVFPELESATRGNWLSLVNMGDDPMIRSLPRVPISDAASALVLNIPPGFYPVEASCWVRKNEPYAGGRTGVVPLASGELVVLLVNEAGSEKPPFDKVSIEVADRLTWGLDSPANLQKYLSKIADDARAKKKSGS